MVAAVIVAAGVGAAGAVGYLYGFERGRQAGAAQTIVERPASQQDTDVAVVPEREDIAGVEPPPAPAGSPSADAVPALPLGPPTAPAADPVDEPASRPGSLLVDSRPRGATVLVNGRRAGVTPMELSAVQPGPHAVRVLLAGYRPIAADVVVRPSEPSRVAVTLEPATGRGRGR